ncbi:MAG: VOC family protein [Clostridia bacterium]|nr:VOC family protein [Clostridia bacterium]NCC75896.1 VOC family protein [Clostridia bacterium]
MIQKIIPNLWFNGNASEAVDFYITAFPDSKITGRSFYPPNPAEGLADFQLELAGKVLTVEFELGQQPFVAINAGPEFSFNPSISFMVNFDPSRDEKAAARLEELWQKLSADGDVLMPLDSYPFSPRYGWVQDRYGLTWQLILTDPSGEPRPFIIPSLLFGGDKVNRAEEAIHFYVSVFEHAKAGLLARYDEPTGPAKSGSLMFGEFMLAGQWFTAMDSGVEQDFTFNEAVSFQVNCQDQDEIDYFWEKLAHDPIFNQCGWCKDSFGLSWQIVPTNMAELMEKPGAFSKLMEMKKIVIADF